MRILNAIYCDYWSLSSETHMVHYHILLKCNVNFSNHRRTRFVRIPSKVLTSKIEILYLKKYHDRPLCIYSEGYDTDQYSCQIGTKGAQRIFSLIIHKSFPLNVRTNSGIIISSSKRLYSLCYIFTGIKLLSLIMSIYYRVSTLVEV